MSKVSITSFLIRTLKKRLPPMSETEREAIEAGQVWWEKDLFCGRPDWRKLLSIPAPTLSPEEQSFLDNQVETLCSLLDNWDIVAHRHDLSQQVWNYLKKEQFFGMVIPKEYGGRGFSALAHSSVILKIATRSVSAAIDIMVPNSLGPGELILHYGTEEQKETYLPKLAHGEEIPCFALTSPDAGSDAGSITDTGVICKSVYQGKEVMGIRLNWDKRYITLAPVATVLGLAVKLYDPEHLLGNEHALGITLCLVPTRLPGVEIGHRHLPLNQAFMNGPTRGKDVFIPLDYIIGGAEKIGQGWKMLMACLSIGRSISLPALSGGAAQFSYRETGAYARLRRQFNAPIASFEAVGEALSQMAGMTYLIEATRRMTAGAVDLKVQPAIASAIAKYHLTEMARRIIEHAMDVHGGHGIQMGPRNYLAEIHVAIPICITVEGANILTRGLIIFGQGAIRCHPYIYQEMQLLSSDNMTSESNKKLVRLLFSHLGYTLSNVVRATWLGLTAGRWIATPCKGPTARYFKQLTRMSAALALWSDVAMLKLGGELKRRELISARLGDILSQLYLASAVLKYHHDQLSPDSDLPYVTWCVEQCLYSMEQAAEDLFQNFPSRWVKIFYKLVFPYGRAYRKPKDKLSKQLLEAMLNPSELRNRLTQLCFVSKKPEELTQKIESAFAAVLHIEPLLKKVQTALKKGVFTAFGPWKDQFIAAEKAGVITTVEKNQLIEFENIYQEIIKVDEFSFDLQTLETENKP